MNKFRNNLHSALFSLDGDGPSKEYYGYGRSTNPENLLEADRIALEATTRRALDNGMNDVIENPTFSNVVKSVIDSKKGTEKFDEYQTRFNSRLESTDSQQQKYADVRNKKIEDGYADLLSRLESSGYFDKLDKTAKSSKIAEVARMYYEEVQGQYSTNIWDAEDDKFNEIKDIIFSKDSKNYPADRLFNRLTKVSKNSKQETKVRTHDINLGEDNESDSSVESTTTKKRISFFAHDLPNCLWDLKDKNEVRFLLVFTRTVDTPSNPDKEHIEKFIQAVDKLNGDKPELALLKVFQLRDLDTQQIKEKLAEFNVSLKNEKDIKYIKEAYDFYRTTQVDEADEKNQHGVYLSIMQIIEKYGGFDKAANRLEKEVAKIQAERSEEGKDYKKGKKLDGEDKAFVDALYSWNGKDIDYTSATRLFLRGADYFQNTDIVDILADLNNDGRIMPSDKGVSKTGLQFKETYKYVGEELALKNLLEFAKKYNSLVLGDQALPETDFTAEQIKAGNKKLILILQMIIANPGQDLYTLMMYGLDAAERNKELYESLKNAPESADDPRVQAAATKMLNDTGVVSAFEGVTPPEGLHQAVAGALYTEYMKGVGLGGRISFDEWVKGLSLNGGIQVTENGVSIGLSLAYNREIDLGKGWTMTPGASVGFISMLQSPLPIPTPVESVGVGVAKEWLRDNGVEQKIGGKISFSLVGTVPVFSAFVGWERDKANGIEQQRVKAEKEFNNVIITPLLDKIAEKFGDNDFDLEKEENQKIVKDAVDEVINDVLGADKSKFSDNDINRLKANTIRYLLNYNKAPINNKKVRQDIANEMSKRCSNAWAEQRINDIDGKTYLSRASIGASWIVGNYIPCAVHLGVGLKTHNADMYADRSWNKYNVDAISGSRWDQEMVDFFNGKMPVSPEAKLSLSEWEGKSYVTISPKMMEECDIRINPGMEGCIKKDDKGNVLLHQETLINLATSHIGGIRKSVKVLIGGGDFSSATSLDTIINQDLWFAKGEIDTSKLTGKENIFTEFYLNETLKQLKASEHLKDDKVLQNFNIDTSILSNFEQGKKYRITLEKKNSKIVTSRKPVDEGDDLQIEYIGNDRIDLMSSKAQHIADIAYEEAARVTTNKLYSISHGSSRWSEYKSFAMEVKKKNYAKAKDIIIKMLPKMDRFIGEGVDFDRMVPDLEAITDEVELGQAMLSINNIFARVTSVHGGSDGVYHFKRYDGGRLVDNSMGNIIGLRSGEIERKIKSSSLAPEVKGAYTSLIGAMEDYRKNNPAYYEAQSKKTETLKNAVGINLGNSINIENPLFNPEIYADSRISLNQLKDFTGKDQLQQHAMEVMAGDKSLMGPVLKALGVEIPEGNNKIQYKFESYENGELTIDIGGEKIKFKAKMSVGYFAQCVNHMILLDEIEAEIVGGNASVQFAPGVMGNGENNESTIRTLVGTSASGINVSIGIDGEGGSHSTPGIDGEGGSHSTPGVDKIPDPSWNPPTENNY